MSVSRPVGAPAGWQDRALERSLAAARDRSWERARRLVDAARRLVAGGSSTFTVAEVAAEAGVSLRSFYRHFASRDELLLALFEEEARTGAEVLAGMLGDGPPVERVRRAVDGLCSLVVTGEGYAALLVREHLRLGEQFPDELRKALAPLLDLLEQELRAAAAAGELAPVDRFTAATVLALALAHVQTAALLAPSDRDAAVARTWAFCRAALAPGGDAR